MITTDPDVLVADVLVRAIAEVRSRAVDVFTFALYHDHESAAVSVCVDTEINSARFVSSQNAFYASRFVDAVAKGDLQTASLFRANAGRSLSLGDFEMANVARTDLRRVRADDSFYLSMVRTLRGAEREIGGLSRHPQRLLFCASSANDEVGYLWTAEPAAA